MMPESFESRLTRWKFNWFPAYRGTGARVAYIAADWREVRIRLPLNWRTRNYVGTIYGGSMYAGVDPIYMVMLIRLLGREYVVWDKAATIRFRRPGRTTLHASFIVPPEETAEIRRLLEEHAKIERDYRIDLCDGDGEVHAVIEKIIHISRADGRT